MGAWFSEVAQHQPFLFLFWRHYVVLFGKVCILNGNVVARWLPCPGSGWASHSTLQHRYTYLHVLSYYYFMRYVKQAIGPGVLEIFRTYCCRVLIIKFSSLCGGQYNFSKCASAIHCVLFLQCTCKYELTNYKYLPTHPTVL